MKNESKVDFAATLMTGLRQMALSKNVIADDKLRALGVYFSELDKWRRKINLVAKAEPWQIIENHFLDSLTLLPLIEPYETEESPSLLDIGSGAGFPGLVLKIVCPWLKVILVEPRQKRVSFLKHIIRTLSLTNIDLREERLAVDEETFRSNYGQPDIITSRAVADIKSFLAMLTVSSGRNKIICMKGLKAEMEIEAWRNTTGSPFTLIDRQCFTLPLSGAKRALIVFGRQEQ